MAEATVTLDTGTVAPPTVTETVEVVETPKQSLAETERMFRENYDKSIGRDLTKLFPHEVKKPETKVEVKAEEKPKEEVKAETKVEVKKEDEPKPKSGNGRTRLALKLARKENEELKGRIAAIEAKLTPATTETKAETKPLVEPQRKDFENVDDFIVALRKYDKEQAAVDSKKAEETKLTEELQRQTTLILDNFFEQRDLVKKEFPDWDKVVEKANVEFNPILQGVIFTADPRILYHFATHQKEARALNELGESSVMAIGNSDEVTGILKYLGANPKDIKELNSLSPVKAQKYIGKLESKIESLLTESNKDDSVDPKRTSSGVEAKSEVKTGATATEATKTPTPITQVKQDRVRPEPPAKLAGGAPQSNTWTEPVAMSLADRERLWREDPKNRKR